MFSFFKRKQNESGTDMQFTADKMRRLIPQGKQNAYEADLEFKRLKEIQRQKDLDCSIRNVTQTVTNEVMRHGVSSIKIDVNRKFLDEITVYLESRGFTVIYVKSNKLMDNEYRTYRQYLEGQRCFQEDTDTIQISW